MATPHAASTATELLAAQWPFILTAILASAVVWGLQLLLKDNAISKFPLVGGEIQDESKRRAAFTSGAKHMYMEGYRKVKNGLFRIPQLNESTTIVVHPRFLKELASLPDDQVSFHESIAESMHGKWTEILAVKPLLPYALKKDLTPALSRLNPTIAEEVDLALREELPPCKDFTRVHLNSCLLRIVAKASGRIFVGPELSRSEEYLDMSINFTVELIAAVRAISKIRPEEREFKAPRLPECIKLTERRKNTMDFLRPIVVARKKAIADDPNYERPDDLVQWILDGDQTKHGEPSDHDLAEVQLGVGFAAIHTTTITTTNAFYTIAAMPELVPELREEIRTVLDECGNFTSTALQRMKKLDSFLREVMRMYPISFSSFNRKVLKPITLSTGQVIPAGVMIEVPSYSTMNDPELVNNPQEFDALRSYRAREQAGLGGVDKASAAAANQLVTVSPTNLIFGYGRHACPGRFFAANEIKMIVGRTLLDYDIKLVDGETERYRNIEFQTSYIPDTSKDLMFKRIVI